MTDLEKSILKTICFFDALAYPLTFLEVWKWLETKATLSEVSAILASFVSQGRLESKSGFYFLAGQDSLVASRLSRQAAADQKFKKAKRILMILRFFPWIKGSAVYSSLSFFNARPESDIDLFLIADRGRVWSARFFVNLFLKFFRLRPSAQSGRDKICASFWADEDDLDLSKVNNDADWLYVFGTGQFIFLYSSAELARKFFDANKWLGEKMPNWQPYLAGNRLRVGDFGNGLKKFFNFVFGLVPEKNYQKFQLAILPARFKTIMNTDKRVVVSNGLIKLHDHDRRAELQKQFEEKFSQVLNYGE